MATLFPILAQSFIEDNPGGIGQVEAAGRGAHWDGEAMLGMGSQERRGETFGFSSEDNVVSRSKDGVPERPLGLGGDQMKAGRRKRGVGRGGKRACVELRPGFPHVPVEVLPIIKPGALPRAVIQ